ncbi:hypothetical protein [Methylobacterium brachiatum]|uniref:hypothetical protein n=1 Tax=Methylobacterium brachiatum TaxID=269660 RepID=UPI00244CCA44|nr:hypothetical protein [Methylobacterium brachiatum]MDH2313161.1 hypothetical protein [Methylobacterium brachiatum]
MAIRRASLAAAAILPVGGPSGVPGQNGRDGTNGRDGVVRSIAGVSKPDLTLVDIGAAPAVPSRFLIDGGATVTPQDVYTSAFPGVALSDTSQAVLDVAPGDQRDNLSAVAGYVRTRSGGAGFVGKGNAVALFGCVQIAANYSAGWGGNILITDHTERAVSNGTGRIATGFELDFNIMSPNTHVTGISIGGNSLSQPTDANGFLVNSLGTGIKWNAGFWSLDGCARYALVAGVLEISGKNIGSQPILLQYFDGSGVKQTSQIQAAGGFAVISGAPNGLKLSFGNVGLDPGYVFTVGGVQVVAGRKTGWTAGSGTPNRGSFNADYTQTMGASYSQAQIQALQNQLLATQQRLLALESDLRAHGLIGA